MYKISKPIEYMSDRPGRLSETKQGQVQPGVPPDRPAVPKSPIFIEIVWSSFVLYKTFSGLRSLWHFFDVSSCWRPSSNCLQISTDCESENFLFCFEMFPSHSSKTKMSYFFTFSVWKFSKSASFLSSSTWSCCLEIDFYWKLQSKLLLTEYLKGRFSDKNSVIWSSFLKKT